MKNVMKNIVLFVVYMWCLLATVYTTYNLTIFVLDRIQNGQIANSPERTAIVISLEKAISILKQRNLKYDKMYFAAFMANIPDVNTTEIARSFVRNLERNVCPLVLDPNCDYQMIVEATQEKLTLDNPDSDFTYPMSFTPTTLVDPLKNSKSADNYLFYNSKEILITKVQVLIFANKPTPKLISRDVISTTNIISDHRIYLKSY